MASAEAQAVIWLAAASFLVFVVWLVSLVVRTIGGRIRRLQNRRTTTKQPVPSSKQPSGDHVAASAGLAAAKQRGPDLKTLIKQQQAAARKGRARDDDHGHALFIATLKGHGDAVEAVAWSADGNGLSTACADLQVRIFDVHNLGNKDPKFRFVRLPHPPMGVGFGATSSSVVVMLRGLANTSVLARYSAQPKRAPSDPVTFKEDWTVQQALGREQLLDMVTAPEGGAIVALSTKKEGRVWGLDGRPLATFEPNSLANHGLAVSGDGRFIAVASFTAEVKVWELSWGREGFKGCSKVMDLKGHSSQVMAAALNADGSRAVTASRDGSMRLWNLAVRYHMQEDPKTLVKADLGLPAGRCYVKMAWGPGNVIAATLPGGVIHFLSGQDLSLVEELHAHDSDVTALAWAPRLMTWQGEQVAVLATCSGDRRVRLWRSP